MINRLKKLPVWTLVIVVMILLCPTYVLLARSELRSRLVHKCYNLNETLENCYTSYYRATAIRSGTKEALRQISERILVDKRLNSNCHQSMHAIGRNAFKEFGSIAKAYEEANYSCWGGFMHGVVEASMSRKKMSDISAESLRTMCDETKVAGETSFAHFSCVHGVGHALMYIGHNDLPNVLIRCDDLIDKWETRQCANGAFMENILADADHPSKFQPKDDLNFPCTIVREKDRDVCYQVQSKFILDHMKGDFKKAFIFCNDISVPEYRNLCAQGVGAGVSLYTAYNTKVISLLCTDTPGTLKGECLYGALTDLEGQTGNTKLGKEVCQNQPEAEQADCIQILNRAHVAFPGAIKNSEGWSENAH